MAAEFTTAQVIDSFISLCGFFTIIIGVPSVAVHYYRKHQHKA